MNLHGNKRIKKYKEIFGIIKRIVRNLKEFSDYKLEEVSFRDISKLLIPVQLRPIYWIQNGEILIEHTEIKDSLTLEIKKLLIDDNCIQLFIRITNENNEKVKITKGDTSISVNSKRYKCELLYGTDTDTYDIIKLSRKVLFQFYSDTDIHIKAKECRKNNFIEGIFQIPLNDELFTKNITPKDYLGFCCYGGFTGILSVLGLFIIMFVLLLLQHTSFYLYIGIILFLLECLIVRLSFIMNKRIYAIMRNNLYKD